VTPVSVGLDNAATDGDSIRPQISPDGRYVIFASAASNLVAGDANSQFDAFIFDRQTGTTDLLSEQSIANLGNGDSSWGAAIAASGIYGAFGSTATNLTGDAPDGFANVFLVDTSGGTKGTVVSEDSVSTLSTTGTLVFVDTLNTDGVTRGVSWSFVSAVGSNGAGLSPAALAVLASSDFGVNLDDHGNGTGEVTWPSLRTKACSPVCNSARPRRSPTR
jgi:hypothetical protein